MNDLKTRAMKALFDRYMRWRIDDLAHPQSVVVLEYPIHPRPRYGEGRPAHPELEALLARNDDVYGAMLAAFARLAPPLAVIAEEADAGHPGEPHWANTYFSALDAIALYGFMATTKPARYFEVGSGNSTKFAARAVRDHGLATQIVSLDPSPRAEVDALCDRRIRAPLEDVDTSVFAELDRGDILFVDNSHRVFQNSDATVFFLEVLPRLRSGVRVHVHDVFLPYDYPQSWAERHYSEQYLLAAYLLAGNARFDVVLPLAYVSRHRVLARQIAADWDLPVFERAFHAYRELTAGYAGVSFWLEIR